MIYPLLVLTMSVTFASDDPFQMVPQVSVIDYIGMLVSTSGLLPILFRVYNYGMLACVIMMSCFNLLYVGAVAASDGAGVARKTNAWLFVRSIAGAAMLIPIGQQKYAFIQYVILQIVNWSVQLVQFVFASIVLTTGATTTDSLQQRLYDQEIGKSYTQALAMSYCALSQTDSPILVWDNDSLSYSFKGTDANGEPVVLSQCGKIHRKPDENFQKTMALIVNNARAAARQVSSRLWAEASVRDFDLDGLREQETLLGELCKTATVCWNKTLLQPGHAAYADAMDLESGKQGNFGDQLIDGLNDAFDRIDLESSVLGFSHISEKLLFPEEKKKISYAVPRYSSPSPTPMANWSDKGLDSKEEKNEDGSRKTDAEVEAYRIQKHKEGLEKRVLLAFSSVAEKWSEPWRKDTSQSREVIAYTGTDAIKNKIITVQKMLRDHKGFPRHLPQLDRTRHRVKNINTVQDHMEDMLMESIQAVTGCTAESCGDTNGGFFSYQNKFRQKGMAPVAYIQNMGEGILYSAIRYQRGAVMGREGVIKMGDALSRLVYGSSVPLLAAGVGAQIALSVYPFTSYARAGVFLSNAVVAEMIELLGFLADKDQYAIYKYAPLGSALSSLFMIWGGLFGIFLPYVPFMIFMIAMVGWIFLVLESMIASPLIALGLTHPSTHQFLGASDQSLIMFLLLLLRPVTILIALVISVYISHSALFFLNEGIIRFLELYYANVPGVTVSQVLGFTIYDTEAQFVATLFGIMLVYSYVVFVVLIQSFSVMGMLPDKIGQWIGQGPLGGSSVIQQVFAMRSAFEGGAQQAAQGAGGMSKAQHGSHSGDSVKYARILSPQESSDRMGAANPDSQFGLSGNKKKLAKQLLKDKNMNPADRKALLNILRNSKGAALFGPGKGAAANSPRTGKKQSHGKSMITDRLDNMGHTRFHARTGFVRHLNSVMNLETDGGQKQNVSPSMGKVMRKAAWSSAKESFASGQMISGIGKTVFGVGFGSAAGYASDFVSWIKGK